MFMRDAMKAGRQRLHTIRPVAGETPRNQLEAPTTVPTGPHWMFPAVAVGLLAMTYILTGPGNRTEADDAFWFAYDIENLSIRDLMSSEHTAHLLFMPLARGFWNLTRLLGFEIRAYDAIRLANCVLAAASVVLLGYALRSRLRLSSFAAIAGAMGLALSYGFWRYANETEVYAVAVLTIVGLCWVCFSGLHSLGSVLLAGVLATLGGFIHILGFIPALVLVPLALLVQRRVRDAALYLLIVALLAGAVSHAAYRYAAPSGQGFVDYVLVDRASAGQGVLAVPAAVLALAQDVVTGNFLFAYPGVVRRLAAAFPSQYLDEEWYAGRQSDIIVRIVPLITLPVLFLIVAAGLWRTWRDRRHLNPRNARGVYLIAVMSWIAVYWVVVVVRRSSAAPEAWIPLLPAVWILVSAVVLERARTPRSQALVLALLAALLAHNVAGGLWMMHSRSTDLNFLKSQWILDHAGAGDLILTADGPVFERYLRYYSRAEVVGLAERPADAVATIYDEAVRQHRRIFATTGVFDPPAQIRVINPTTFEAIKEFAATVRPDFRKVAENEFGRVYLRR
jgi:hypothetical protein